MALQANVEFPQMSLNFKLLIFKIDKEMLIWISVWRLCEYVSYLFSILIQ